ncbi:MAG: hypothetical protein LUM44_08110 [Pyrinomonadaceae bacterium]|nr:hypothetical protein [Pyrinomonadaceae bacterium]
MRKILFYFCLCGLLLTINQTRANAKTALDIPVEVIEIREIGLSDRDESKTVIEILWRVDPLQKEKIESFNLFISAVYADGTVLNEKRTAVKNSVSVRVEIPSVKTVGNHPSASIKKISAKVSAVLSRQSKQTI